MVTTGFYDRSRIGLWLFEVMGREYDEMADWAQELRKEAHPQTCTWSIGIWEFIYDIEPDDTLPLEFRRGRILSKRLQHPPINPARIEAALSAITGTPVKITDFVAPYTFMVELDESDVPAVNIDLMYRTLRQMKPSHLSFGIGSIIITEFTVYEYFAGAIGELTREFFYEEVEIITDGSSYDAAVLGELIREVFADDGDPIITDIVDSMAGAIAEVIRDVFTEEGSPILTDTTDYDAGVEVSIIREYIIEITPISTTATANDGGATHEIVKEAYTENG
jgi:hypothetical protein